MWGRERALGLVLPALFPWVTWRPVFSTLGFSIYSEPFLLRHVALGGPMSRGPSRCLCVGGSPWPPPRTCFPAMVALASA